MLTSTPKFAGAAPADSTIVFLTTCEEHYGVGQFLTSWCS